MTAPATSHDLRCTALSSPDPSRCTCRGAVVRLSGRASGCGFCGGPPAFRIGRDELACEAHVGAVLTHFYATDYDGFSPAVVTLIRPRGGAA